MNNNKAFNKENVYKIELEGHFKKLYSDLNSNDKFEKELFKVLPKDIIAMTYTCTCCGRWVGSQPYAICDMCAEHYENDLESLEDESTVETIQMIDYYENMINEKLNLNFITKTPVDIEQILKEFEAGEYIKNISISKVDYGNVTEFLFDETCKVENCGDRYKIKNY